MPDDNIAVRLSPVTFNASPASHATVSNAGPGTVFYKKQPNVSAIDNDGSLGAGQKLTYTEGPRWFVSPSGSRLFVTYSPERDTDMATQAELDETEGGSVKLAPVVNTAQVFQSKDGDNPVEAVKYQATPVHSEVATSGFYEDSGGGGVFHLSSYVENTGDRPTVAVFGGATGSHVFGGNFVAYTDGSDHSALGIEIDFGNLNETPGGVSHGLVIKSLGGNVGGQGGENFIQMQAATASPAEDGIKFHASSGVSPVGGEGALLLTDVGVSARAGLDFTTGVFTSASLSVPVNSGSTEPSIGVVIQATGGFANTGGYMQIQSTSGSTPAFGIKFHKSGGVDPVQSGAPLITADCTAGIGLDFSTASFTTAAMALPPGGNIAASSTTGSKIATSSAQKLGFWGATPIARPGVYTQTYSAAERTVPNATASSVPETAPTKTEPWGFASEVQAKAVLAAINKDQEDLAALKKVVNALIDDHQAMGLAS